MLYRCVIVWYFSCLRAHGLNLIDLLGFAAHLLWQVLSPFLPKNIKSRYTFEKRWQGEEVRSLFSPAPLTYDTYGQPETVFWSQLKAALTLRYNNEATFKL